MQEIKPLYPVGYWVGMGLPQPSYNKFFDNVSKVSIDLTNGYVDNGIIEELNKHIANAESLVKQRTKVSA